VRKVRKKLASLEKDTTIMFKSNAIKERILVTELRNGIRDLVEKDS